MWTVEEGERSGFIAVLGANVTVRWVNRRAEAQMGWRAGEDAGGTGAGWGRYSGGTRCGPGSMGAFQPEAWLTSGGLLRALDAL